MSKPKDNLSITIVCIALSCLVAGFGFAWFYQQANEEKQVQVAYVAVGPLLITAQDYAFSASLSLQTSAKDAKWASENKSTLTAALQLALANANPQSLRDHPACSCCSSRSKKPGMQRWEKMD